MRSGPSDQFAPSDPYAPSDPFGQAAPHEDDVKVAGSAPTQVGGAPAGDTLGFGAVPAAEPLRTGVFAEGPRDELVSGRHAQRPSAGRAGSGGRGGSGGRTGMRIVAVAAGAAVVIGGGAVAAFALTGGSGGDDATVKPTKQLADAAPKVDPKVLEEQRRKLALDRASRATRQDGGESPSLHPKGTPVPTKKPDEGGGGTGPIGDPVPAGEAQEIAKKLMPGFGFTGDGQFGCLVKLWNKESHWNVHADNPSSEAYGIPQANPGSKMSSAGPDWQNNATTQIKWGLGYIKDRYSSPCGAWSHSQSVGWY
ncbi:aggregation-promoting factor C-terminal-like domain-containing protein [Actinomadura soli]|uniref:aggregation-promoting factor C-terminal-like domain-containing protein n=1 Tax=Actinomadura soli TaxID=2508997 RepID=UPI00197AD9EE|nr:lytic transglycosylase domain-containing protein [Actinomadura soli]